MQIGRLFGIVYFLLNNKNATARELAAHFEVSARTIYRDIDTLSQSGIPVYASKGKGGGICLMEDYVLNKSLLSAREQDDILAALHGMNSLAFSDAQQILAKMSSVFHREAAEWIRIDFSDWSHEHSDIFFLLKNAIQERRVVTFRYHNTSGGIAMRTVEPQCLWFKHGAWYLKGFCRDRGEMRTFRISRMKRLTVLDETFLRTSRESNPAAALAAKPVNIVRLVLKIDKSLSYRVYDEFDESLFRQDDSGDFIVTVSYPVDEWVYGFLLSFGPCLEVLEPSYMRGIIAERLAAALRLYRKDGADFGEA